MQGDCGDCYFMATLAAIAHKQPHYIQRMLKPGDHLFEVGFVNADGEKVSSAVNDKFWQRGENDPIYARISRTVGSTEKDAGTKNEIWPMVIEKAWAKLNGMSYESIVGSNSPKFEYSYAVTGKRAKYMSIDKNTDSDLLLQLMTDHFVKNNLPITLYSVSDDTESHDPCLVTSHAYALKEIHEDGSMDIFNPWNDHKEEGEEGQHFTGKDVHFIHQNFDTVIFFSFEEVDWDSQPMDNFIDNQITYTRKPLPADRDVYLQIIADYLNNLAIHEKIVRVDLPGLFENKLELKTTPDLDQITKMMKKKSEVMLRQSVIANYNNSLKRAIDYSWHCTYKQLNHNLSMLDIANSHNASENNDSFNLYRLLTALQSKDIIKK